MILGCKKQQTEFLSSFHCPFYLELTQLVKKKKGGAGWGKGRGVEGSVEEDQKSYVRESQNYSILHFRKVKMTKLLPQTPSTGKHQVYISAPDVTEHVGGSGEAFNYQKRLVSIP